MEFVSLLALLESLCSKEASVLIVTRLVLLVMMLAKVIALIALGLGTFIKGLVSKFVLVGCLGARGIFVLEFARLGSL